MNACKRNDSIKKGLLKCSAIQQAITVPDKYFDIFCKVHNLQQTFLESENKNTTNKCYIIPLLSERALRDIQK